MIYKNGKRREFQRNKVLRKIYKINNINKINSNVDRSDKRVSSTELIITHPSGGLFTIH